MEVNLTNLGDYRQVTTQAEAHLYSQAEMEMLVHLLSRDCKKKTAAS